MQHRWNYLRRLVPRPLFSFGYRWDGTAGTGWVSSATKFWLQSLINGWCVWGVEVCSWNRWYCHGFCVFNYPAFCDKTINNSEPTRLLFSVISDIQRCLRYSSSIVLGIKYVFLIKIVRFSFRNLRTEDWGFLIYLIKCIVQHKVRLSLSWYEKMVKK